MSATSSDTTGAFGDTTARTDPAENYMAASLLWKHLHPTELATCLLTGLSFATTSQQQLHHQGVQFIFQLHQHVWHCWEVRLQLKHSPCGSANWLCCHTVPRKIVNSLTTTPLSGHVLYPCLADLWPTAINPPSHWVFHTCHTLICTAIYEPSLAAWSGNCTPYTHAHNVLCRHGMVCPVFCQSNCGSHFSTVLLHSSSGVDCW